MVSRAQRSGSIHYRLAFVPNPSYRGGRVDLFSATLAARIRRQNVPEGWTVYFDGQRSRREEINLDYGVRSLSFELRDAKTSTITYCKQLRTLGFCMQYATPVPVGGPPPDVMVTGETQSIGGFRCTRAEYRGPRQLEIWFTQEIAIDDSSGGILQLVGVPGLLMQTQEIADNHLDAVQRVTVTDVSFEAPPPTVFSVPPGFRTFPDAAAARAEDRQNFEAAAAEETRYNPLSDTERDMFVGDWLFHADADELRVRIARVGENEFRFHSTVLTAPADAPGRDRDEPARMLGRALLVEDPPGYRLYMLDGPQLRQLDDDVFRFNRA